MRRAVFPGSFDPVTLGHLHLIERASRLYDEVIVVIGANSQKNALFSVEERRALLTECLRSVANVRVDVAEGLLVDKVKELGADVMLRGVRDVQDFAYEKQIAWANHELDPGLETVCLFAHEEYGALSSTIIREFASYGKDVSKYVPENVARAIRRKYTNRHGDRKENDSIRLEKRETAAKEKMEKTMYDWLKENKIPFSRRDLIKEALTHTSYLNEHRDVVHDNERLEFMGDAVLQLWTTEKLFQLEPRLSEGKMTTLRSQLVCEAALAHYSRQLGWGAYLLLGVGEERTGGRERDSLLADMFEAMLGALYLDQGMKPVSMILERVLTPAIDEPKNEILIDYKTKLQEVVQADSRKTLRYELLDMDGPTNHPEFEMAVLLDDIVLGKGKGNSKKRAEQMAAKAAFDKMAR